MQSRIDNECAKSNEKSMEENDRNHEGWFGRAFVQSLYIDATVFW